MAARHAGIGLPSVPWVAHCSSRSSWAWPPLPSGCSPEVNPGTDRPDVIRLFGVGCLAIGVGLAAPYVLSTARRDERRSSRPR